MQIEHIAIWTQNIERLKAFYERYFEARANRKYINPASRFESYFLAFASGARLELMHLPSIPESHGDRQAQFTGYIHLAISVGSKDRVDAVTDRLRQAGYPIASDPRTTGDGYYESVVCDPDGNRIEITI